MPHPPPAAEPCNFCGSPIRWLTTRREARMPVDADPHPARGNVVIVGGHAGVLDRRRAAAARARGVPLWLHHAASCPHARRWQRDDARTGEQVRP